MQPSTRIAFNYPIYALDLLPDGTIAIAGGGGLMKSGIPNKCTLLAFDPQSLSLSERASIHLPDAAVALAQSGTTLHAIIGVGVKNFSCTHNTLTPQSSFRYDLRVSATQDQSAVAVSTDLSTLVVASDEGHVVSLSLPRYEKLFSAQLHTQGVTDLAISQHGALVATTSRDRSAYLWRSRTGQIEQILKPVISPDMRTHIRAVRFCQSNPDIIFTIESNPRKGGWVAAWQRPLRTHGTAFKPIASLKISADAITTCSVNTDGTLISASSSEGHVMLLRWDGSSFSLVWSTETKSNWFAPPKPPHDLPITGLRFSESGDYFFSASADYSVAAWPIKRQTDWWRIRRFTFWLLNLFILMFAMLVAEDHSLPSSIRQHRTRLQPYLEPQLSKIQGYVRPFIRNHQAQVQPCLTEIRDALQSRASLSRKRMRPYAEKPREHHTLWKSKLIGTCERISWGYDLFSSNTPSRTEEKDQSQESFDDSHSKRDSDMQRSREKTLVNSETRVNEKRTNEKPSRTFEEPGLYTDTRRIHVHSDEQLHSPNQGGIIIMESQPASDISQQEMNSFEKLVQGERTTAIRFSEQDRHARRAEKEERISPENGQWRSTAKETIDHHEYLHSERETKLAKSILERSIKNHEQKPPGLGSGSQWGVAQSSNTKRSKVVQFQNRENVSERDSLGVTYEKPIKGSGPLSSRDLPKGSKTVSDLSTVNLESSNVNDSSGERNVPIEETDEDPVLAGAGAILQASEAMTVSNEIMERNTYGEDREVLEPQETSSRLISEGSEETTSESLVSEENLLEEVYEEIDSILAESSHIFSKYSSRRDSNR